MKRKILVILFLLFKVAHVAAFDDVADSSAEFKNPRNVPLVQKLPYQALLIEENKKRKAMLEVLRKHNSPMIGEVDTFMKVCQKSDFNCYLLPAITGLESGFGAHILPFSYNPFGWNGGYAIFSNWQHAIETVAFGIQERYIGAGLLTIEQIGSRYAASPTWASRVRYFIGEFEAEEEKLELNYAAFDLKL